jgi:two-component system, NarL family, nitrate/nitrite response regulator NarL
MLNMPSEMKELRRDRASGSGAVVSASPPLPARATVAPAEWRGWSPAKSPVARPGPAATLALIGGQRLLREATASLLTAQDGLNVLGTFGSTDQFLEVEWKSPPAVLLLDCDGGNPGDCQRTVGMLSSPPAESRIVMLCREICEEVVRCATEHRVSGVLLKSYSTKDMQAAIAYTATGRTVMPAGWQRVMAPYPGGRQGLSPRHRQILALIAQGRGNEEIAMDLELSPNTIKFHVRALYSRLGVRNRVEAANQHAQMTTSGGT